MHSRAAAHRSVPTGCGFDQIQATDQATVGAFAVDLSQFSQAGYPVGPGIVIPAAALTKFLGQVDWLSRLLQDFPQPQGDLKLDQHSQMQAMVTDRPPGRAWATPMAIAQAITDHIQRTPVPQAWVASWMEGLAPWEGELVRLSPSCWLPPPHQPILRQPNSLLKPLYGVMEPEHLAASLKQLWTRWFTASSLLLWSRLGIPLEQLHLAVVIQPLPIRHSLDPASSQDQEHTCSPENAFAWSAPQLTISGFMEITPTRLYLQATYGLSESLIQGEVTPDCYEIDRVTGAIRAQLGRKPYAYWHSDLVPLDLPWQQQLTLDDTALQALVALAATGDCLGDRSSLTLEWLLCSEREGGAAAPPLSIMGIWEAAPLPFQQLLSQSQEPSATQGLDSLALQLPPHLRPYRLHSGLAAAPGQRIATAWVTQNLKQEAPASLVDQILVVPTIQPEDLPWLKQAVGVVCEQGGLTCHGAILARELGLPAVVGVAQGTRRLHTGQLLFLDGDRGDVFELKPSVLASSPLPKPTITQSATDAHADSQEEPAMVSDRPTGRAWATPTAIAHVWDRGWSEAIAPPPSLPREPLMTQVWVNLSQSSSIPRAATLPVEGVGLLRSEWMMLEVLEGEHPQRWLQQGRQRELLARITASIQPFAQAFAPRPVFYRTLDLRSPELATLTGGEEVEPLEANPALGLRGVSRYVRDPRFFELELTALVQLRQQGHQNLNLILPFVRSVEEFCFCRERITAVGLTPSAQFQVWMMAEVPSVLFLLPDYVRAGVQGIAIGTNDLTQLLLGVDRDHPLLTPTLNDRHPAVRAAITQLIQSARALGIPCSICGQAPIHDPDLLDEVVTAGVSALSVEMGAVASIRRGVAAAQGCQSTSELQTPPFR